MLGGIMISLAPLGWYPFFLTISRKGPTIPPENPAKVSTMKILVPFASGKDLINFQTKS